MTALLSVRMRDISGRFTVNRPSAWLRMRDISGLHEDMAEGLRDADATERAPGADRRGIHRHRGNPKKTTR